MPQLADNIQNLLKNQINVQTLRNRTNRVGISQQNANTSRVDSLIQAGDYEAAEKVYENEPSNKAKGLTFKFSPAEQILTVKQPKTGETRSFSYNSDDISGSLKLLTGASLPGLTDEQLAADVAGKQVLPNPFAHRIFQASKGDVRPKGVDKNVTLKQSKEALTQRDRFREASGERADTRLDQSRERIDQAEQRLDFTREGTALTAIERAKSRLPGSGANLANANLEFAPPQSTAEQARAAGFNFEVSEKQKKYISDLQALDTVFKELESAAESLKQANIVGLLAGKIPGGQFLPGEIGDSAQFGAALKSIEFRMSQFFDKRLGGVRAASSLPLIKFTAANTLPGIFDSNEVIDFKILAMRTVIQAMNDEAKRAVTGLPRDPVIDVLLNDIGNTLQKIVRGSNAPAETGGGGPKTLEEFKHSRGK